MDSLLPTDAAARKEAPVYSGVLKYFPLAIAAVARLSKIGNDKHNPGEPLHWSREKSSDHGDCIVRHQLEAGTVDADGELHDVKVAWRALAQLQLAEENRLANAEPYPEGCEHCKGWTWKCHKEAGGGDVCGHECEYPITRAEGKIRVLDYFCAKHHRWHYDDCPSCVTTAGSSR